MSALRLCLSVTLLSALTGNSDGQQAPLRDFGQHLGQTSPVEMALSDQFQLEAPQVVDMSPVDPLAEQPPMVEYEVQQLPQASQPMLVEVPPMHGETVEAEPCQSCKCNGEKHCHGVCRDPGRPKKPKWDKPGDRNRGDCPPLRYRIADCKRAGHPHSVAPWAKCSVNGKYSSWFVGGGSPFFFGRCRKPTEGTWGLDYDGPFKRTKNWLNYTRIGRKQGGEGAYQTDGEPKVVSKGKKLLHIGH